jgi:hypothetical protein
MQPAFNLFKFEHPHKARLEDLQMIRGDLQHAIQFTQILLGPPPLHSHAPLFATALQFQALVSYVRCFSTGRRSALSKTLFEGDQKLEQAHEEFKRIRDQHVAHPAGKHEHNELLIAAKSPDSPARGIGSYNFFFAGLAEKDLRRFLKLLRFVAKKVEIEEKQLGDKLARDVMGPKATYARAQRAFASAIHDEQLYPTKRRRGA